MTTSTSSQAHMRSAKSNEGAARPSDSANLLLWRLTVRARERGHTAHDLAHALGISYPYLQALLRGERPIAGASKSVLSAMAAYLGVSVAQAFVWAGVLVAEDFFYQPTLQNNLSLLYDALLHDSDVGPFAPPPEKWRELPDDIKVFIAALYERASGRRFLDPVKIPTTSTS